MNADLGAFKTKGALSCDGTGAVAIAGDTAKRSTDAETGIQRIFDQDQVQKEVDAQVAITQDFSRQASSAAADEIRRLMIEDSNRFAGIT